MKMNAVEFVDAVIGRARRLGASDVHIDPFPKATAVRFRVDGLLRNICTIPPPLHPEVIARIKILAGLRIDVHQTPQDGRFRVGSVGSGGIGTGASGMAASPANANPEECDIRVSILPTHYGENSVMRILAKPRGAREGDGLANLGFWPGDIKNIETALKRRQGLILVTGPTGSGKTTTLYTLLHMINTGDSSIVTLEDPVEYAISGVRQVQVDHKYGMTFVTGLRAILRQDPDIMMIGEIRDAETAKIAVHSALTGHMVISTLHTNSASAALPRLTDMGIDPYLISATLSLVVGQRLVRLVCRECSKNSVINNGDDTNGNDQEKDFGKKFCMCCRGSGYKSRIGIYETLLVDETLRAAIAAGVSPEKAGISMRTMHEDCIEKIADRVTTREELARVLYE